MSKTPSTFIEHSLGSWPVFVHQLDESSEEAWLKEFAALNLHQTVVDTSWRTTGLAYGYLKRLAKHTPDRSSVFHLVSWDRKWIIYFGEDIR